MFQVDPSVSSDGAIWCIKFDVKGEFVATGGQVRYIAKCRMVD